MKSKLAIRPGAEGCGLVVEAAATTAAVVIADEDLDDVVRRLYGVAGRNVIILDRLAQPIPEAATVEVPGGEVGVRDGRVWLGDCEHLPPWLFTWTPGDARQVAAVIAGAADEADQVDRCLGTPQPVIATASARSEGASKPWETTMPDDKSYALALGDKLRAARNRCRLSLAAVEKKSNGRWKAAAVGSYERGYRSISVEQLAELAAFYGVPVHTLLPQHYDTSSTARVTEMVAAALAAGALALVRRCGCGQPVGTCPCGKPRCWRCEPEGNSSCTRHLHEADPLGGSNCA